MTALFPPEEAQARAYHFLKAKISSCEYKPRQRIYAHQVAAEIQVSRTPVREALGRLVHEGLVRKDGGWGYAVRELTSQEIRDLCAVRRALETEAARAALPRLDDAGLARIDKVLEQTRKHLEKGRIAEFVKRSRELHLEIAQASGNATLIELLVALHERIQLLGHMLNTHNRQRSPQVLQENTEIVAALHARDLPRLQAAICAHIDNGCASTIEAMRDAMTP
jgi:DNA-binding GntR family transcriptional regulator